jgi:hypothetical protein
MSSAVAMIWEHPGGLVAEHAGEPLAERQPGAEKSNLHG